MSSVPLSSTSDFTRLARAGKFVDRSSAILDFLRDDRSVHLLLRPRRSGKSTLMSMFQAFFDVGSPSTLQERKALFLDNNLAITNSKKCMGHFGMYPVLYVDLSIIGTTFENLQGEFQELVKTVADDLLKRGLLPNLEKLHKVDLDFLNQILNRKLRADEWQGSLARLSDILHTLHNKEVVVLLDEYDTPMAYAAYYDYYTEANVFFRQVFSPLLKTNKHLRGALVVGIMRIANADWLSGVNNSNVYILGEAGLYSTACMFTEGETRLLYEKQAKTLDNCDSKITFSFEVLTQWYNGYHSGDGKKLYNPWSIARALGGNKINSYWADSGYDRVIMKRIHQLLKDDHRFRKQIEGLLMYEPVTIELDKEMAYSSTLTRRQIWTFLYSAGYLTKWMVEKQDMDMDTGNSTDDDWDTRCSDRDVSSDNSGATKKVIRAQIPNFDIQSIYRHWLLDHFADYVYRDDSNVEMFQQMVSGSMALFAKGFLKLIWTTVPTQLLGSKECVYQAFVSAFLTAIANRVGKWDVQVERCSGKGRLDLLILGDDNAVIQEHRRISMTKEDKRSAYYDDSQRMRLTKEAENGLSQVEAKAYYRARLPDRVTNLREFGIAFLGPCCAIVSRSLKREPGGQWEFEKSYSSERNERHRKKLYTVSA